MAYSNNIRSIAIGSFDGIHLAHKQLIDRVDALVIIERNGGYLTPGYKRTRYTDKMCYFYHFEKVRALTPAAFVAKLCTDFPHLEKIVVGYDFHFGKEKAGNAELLSSLFSKEVEIVKEVKTEDISIHSRTIKNYLKEGNVTMANRLLGRAYEIDGTIVPGQGLGAKELVPTINVNVTHFQLPSEGVYATSTRVAGVRYDSVSFLGHRVTTDGSFAVETHILDRNIEEVEEEIQIAFHRRIRDNQKFETLEALKAQIVLDIQEARLKK